jgi:beta-galactosidase/evolved beta-galactosidase subunit alpha
MPVDELYTPYVVPQENRNRTDVRWVALQKENGSGVFAVSDDMMNFSAHRYSLANLTEATHTNELFKENAVFLNLDYKMRGIGSATCGPDVMPQYELHPHEFNFGIRLRPFSKDDPPFIDLTKGQMERV